MFLLLPFPPFLCSVMGYTLLLNLIEYKTLVMRGDIERANQILPTIPKEHHNRYAQSFTSVKVDQMPNAFESTFASMVCGIIPCM